MEKVDLTKRVQHFQLIAQEKLQTLICSIPGKYKDLIIEPSLIKPLEYICTAPWLRLKGIQRILKLDACNAIPRLSEDHVHLYFLRSNDKTIIRVLKQIKLLQTNSNNSKNLSSVAEGSIAFKTYHLICVPACFLYFHTFVEMEGMHDCVSLHRFNWDFLPLDDFILSMELPNVFEKTFLKSDYSLLPAVTQTFRLLRLICGHAQLTITYGEHSENILNMLSKMPKLTGRSSKNPDKINEFNLVLMVDRNKDYVAPLLTPVTYSGLLLEVFEYNAGFLKLRCDDNKITEQKLPIFNVEKKHKDSSNSTNIPQLSRKPSVLSFHLNGDHDIIYKTNRYKQFGAASSDIRTQAKIISQEPQKLNKMQLKDMHDYVRRKLPEITDLKEKLLCHLSASEILIDMLGGIYQKVQNLECKILNNSSKKNILKEIDELLITDGQRYNIIRLLCLLHVCRGINHKELSQFLQNYCNYFGRNCLTSFQQLAAAGLLPNFCDKSLSSSSSSSSSLLSTTAVSLFSVSPIQKNRFGFIPLNIYKTQHTLFQINSNRLGLMLTESESEWSDKLKDKDKATNNSTTSTFLNNTNQSAAKSDKLPICPSYVYNGLYKPLVAQLCSYILKANNTEDLSAKLSFLDDVRMNGIPVGCYNQSVKKGELPELLPISNRNILIYVLGGMSYAEIAACQLVAKLTESNIYIASDRILSGSDLISAAFKRESI